MARITVAFGVLLVLLGLGAYFGSGSDSPSPTALIPAAFGLLLCLCGGFAFRPAWRKHAMHVAAVVALLGALASSGRAVASLAKLAGGGDVKTRALGSVLIMAATCWVLVALCVKSFIDARRRRAAEQSVLDADGR
jgi:hypothetical protein